MTVQREGIYYSKDLFSKAGITEAPSTMDELDADVPKLKATDHASDPCHAVG